MVLSNSGLNDMLATQAQQPGALSCVQPPSLVLYLIFILISMLVFINLSRKTPSFRAGM